MSNEVSCPVAAADNEERMIELGIWIPYDRRYDYERIRSLFLIDHSVTYVD